MRQSINMRMPRSAFTRQQRGFTLIELIVATAILAILVGAAFPLVRMTIYREREHELRYDLWMLRDAIDRYKDAADRGAFQIKLGSEGLASRAPGFDALWAALYSGGRTPPAYHRSVLSNLAYCRSSSITRRIPHFAHAESSRI